MATKEMIKMAGPDSTNVYRVVTTKGTLRVRPGELYSEDYVKRHLLGCSNRFEVTFVQPKFEDNEKRNKRFVGEVATR